MKLKSKLPVIIALTFMLCGCGAKVNETKDVSKEVDAQNEEVMQEYPKIVFIENASYYGTDEKCEAVPRKAPDGTIKSFVDNAIMPDVDGYANFGVEQGKLEYMFVEDSRLIVHIGDDWYYFEKQGENAAVKTAYKTYEVETFDGTTIKIDETNIISQEKVEDVLETALVPSNAEVIAPGRDFVYLADADKYYVEDAVDQLLTIAKKGDTAENQNTKEDTAEYSANEYSFSYSKTSFETFEDADNNSVTFSYCKDGVETAGSNVITFTIVKDAKPKELLEEKVEALGGKKADVMELSLTATTETCYTYIQSGSSTESELKTSQILYAIPCGNDVIYIDGFRTIGPDEGVEMSIDADFEQIMQTLALKK